MAKISASHEVSNVKDATFENLLQPVNFDYIIYMQGWGKQKELGFWINT